MICTYHFKRFLLQQQIYCSFRLEVILKNWKQKFEFSIQMYIQKTPKSIETQYLLQPENNMKLSRKFNQFDNFN